MTPAVIQREGLRRVNYWEVSKVPLCNPGRVVIRALGEVVKARLKQVIAMANAVDCDPQHQWSFFVVRGFALLPSEASFLIPSVTDGHRSTLDLSDSLS